MPVYCICTMIYACDIQEAIYTFIYSCMRTGVCPMLSNTTEMYVSFSSTQNFVHSVASYTCKFGYGMVGPCTQTCLSTGDWNGFSPNCYRKLKLMYIHVIGYNPYQMSLTSHAHLFVSLVMAWLALLLTRTCLSTGEWSSLLTCPN